MYGAAIIIFREVLEAALIVCIVLAATRDMQGRGRAVWVGIGAGVAGAGLLAAVADTISATLAGVGQEVLNAGILCAAVVMLAWHNIWMSRHARELTSQLRDVSAKVQAGEATKVALTIVVGLAILREGSEVVLFMYSLAAAGGSAAELFIGGLIGGVIGVGVGFVLYFGLARIPMKPLFAITRWLLLLLAAGLAAQAARFLVQAGILPGFQPLWDTSNWLSLDSIVGQVLHILIGYDPAPSGLQLAVYIATAAVILAGMLISDRLPQQAKAQTA